MYKIIIVIKYNFKLFQRCKTWGTKFEGGGVIEFYRITLLFDAPAVFRLE